MAIITAPVVIDRLTIDSSAADAAMELT